MRRSWILLFALMVFGSALMSACSSLPESLPLNNGAAAQEEDELQTAPVRQGDITISATGAGTIVPAEEIVIGFNSGGVLQELLVGVGQEVQTGDVLARLDSTSAQQQVAKQELEHLGLSQFLQKGVLLGHEGLRTGLAGCDQRPDDQTGRRFALTDDTLELVAAGRSRDLAGGEGQGRLPWQCFPLLPVQLAQHPFRALKRRK